MWYPATIAAPATEPVTADQAYEQCRIGASEQEFFNTEIARLITVARAHAENYCNVRFGVRSAGVNCDSWTDLARLPDAPVNSITSITYVDADGATQTLATSVYELRSDGLQAAVVLKYAQAWPSIQPGSRIRVTASIGYAATPEDVVHAMLLNIADMFGDHESGARPDFTTIDALLCNHRRGG